MPPFPFPLPPCRLLPQALFSSGTTRGIRPGVGLQLGPLNRILTLCIPSLTFHWCPCPLLPSLLHDGHSASLFCLSSFPLSSASSSTFLFLSFSIILCLASVLPLRLTIPSSPTSQMFRYKMRGLRTGHLP